MLPKVTNVINQAKLCGLGGSLVAGGRYKINPEDYLNAGVKSSVIRVRRMTPPLLKEEIFTPPKILPLVKGDVGGADRGI